MKTPVVAGGGIGVLVLVVVVMLLGGDPRPLLQNAPVQQAPGPAGAAAEPLTAEQQEIKAFAATMLADSEDVWNRLFAQVGRSYEEPTMVLFSNAVDTGCGRAGSGTGPFYCPADRTVYLDPTFFQQLSMQLGAPGDFAQAYVIAHEVGHHVQNLLGYTDRVDRARRTQPPSVYNEYSVRLELQADFLAGVMLHHANQMYRTIEPGDVEEALRAAAAIGDDTLQRRSQGYVNPETFTHGTSQQRLRWLNLGLETGDLSQGDTFADGRL